MRGAALRGFIKDLFLAVRSLRRRPGLSATAVITLALGIGSTVAVFSLVKGILLSPMPFSEPEQVIQIWGARLEQGFDQVPIAVADYRDISSNTDAFQTIAAAWFQSGTLVRNGVAEEVRQGFVTEEWLPLLGVQLTRGTHLSNPTEAVLSHSFWQSRLGGDPAIIDNTLSVQGSELVVVGILAADADPTVPALRGQMQESDVFQLMSPGWLNGSDRMNGWLRVQARLRDGVSIDQAQSQLDRVAAEIRSNFASKDEVGFTLNAVSVHDATTRAARPVLLLLSVAVVVVLLISCINVASLMIVRGQSRSREVAVRAALGGGRRQILQQVMSESLVLAMVAGVLGTGLAAFATTVVTRLNPAELPRLDGVAVDLGVLGFAIAISALAAVVFGSLPAYRATRVNLVDGLKERSDSSAGQLRSTRYLVVAEVALSIALLSTAGLFLRSFQNLLGEDPGYSTRGVLTLSVTPPRFEGDEARERGQRFLTDVARTLESIPGVKAAGATFRMPLAGGLLTGPYLTEDSFERGITGPEADLRYITPGYFEAMGARLMSGRDFTNADSANVAIVDSRMAESAWPDQNPIGKRVLANAWASDSTWATVIGVVVHMRNDEVSEPSREAIYFPVRPHVWNGMAMRWAVSADADAAGLANQVQQAVASVSTLATVTRIQTMERMVADSISNTTFQLAIVSVFAVLALTLASIGIYGVISYSVSQRTRELGVRMAMGATNGDVLRHVLMGGLKLALAGVSIGLVAALTLGNVAEALFYGVGTFDPVTLISVASISAVSALAATYVPARRALKVDITRALRWD